MLPHRLLKPRQAAHSRKKRLRQNRLREGIVAVERLGEIIQRQLVFALLGGEQGIAEIAEIAVAVGQRDALLKLFLSF
jgi:hypothetical protein